MRLLRHALWLFTILLLIGPVYAQSTKPSRDDVQSLTIKAADYIASHGIDAAEKAFIKEGEYRHGEIYVNVIDMSGNWIIYPPKPENKGKTILNFIDEEGRKLGEDILNTGRKGEGWTEYRWRNPANNNIQPKITYVKQVPSKPYIVYIGVYK